MTIDSYEDVPENDEAALQKAVSQQPISVAICANDLQFYSSGVVTQCCKELDHGVLAAGYGEVRASALHVQSCMRGKESLHLQEVLTEQHSPWSADDIQLLEQQ